MGKSRLARFAERGLLACGNGKNFGGVGIAVITSAAVRGDRFFADIQVTLFIVFVGFSIFKRVRILALVETRCRVA
jgi:hypothetical protein